MTLIGCKCVAKRNSSPTSVLGGIPGFSADVSDSTCAGGGGGCGGRVGNMRDASTWANHLRLRALSGRGVWTHSPTCRQWGTPSGRQHDRKNMHRGSTVNQQSIVISTIPS